MTSNRPNDGPDGGRPPANRNRKPTDQGDLWADDIEGQATPNPAPPPAARRTTRRVPPDTPRRDRPAVSPESAPREQPGAAQPPLAINEPRPRPAEPYDEYQEYEEEDAYLEEEHPSILSNPYLLAGIAVAGAIVLAVFVVLFFGGGDDEPASPGVTTNANATRTPTPTADDASPSVTGLAARSIAISTVREGPALSYLELGTLPSNQTVDVVGRNEDASWIQIVFPPETQLTGWVPNSALRLPDNVIDVVAVTEPTPVTRPEVPTPTTAPVVEDTPTPTATEATTGPDLAVFIASDCAPGSEIKIVVTNTGTLQLTGEPIEVVVSANGVVKYQQSFQADMAVGASADLDTGVLAESPQMEVSVVLKDLEDVDPSNNLAGCVVSGGNQPPPVPTEQAQ